MTEATKTPDEEWDTSHLTFPPFHFDLDSIPPNEVACADEARFMPTFRLAMVCLRFDDKELTRMVRSSPEAFLDLTECVASAVKIRKGRVSLLETALARLCVALERVALEIERREQCCGR